MIENNTNNLVGLKNYCIRYFKGDELVEVLEEEEYDDQKFTRYGKRNGYNSMVVEKSEIIADKKL
jgi:hypothetical protein